MTRGIISTHWERMCSHFPPSRPSSLSPFTLSHAFTHTYIFSCTRSFSLILSHTLSLPPSHPLYPFSLVWSIVDGRCSETFRELPGSFKRRPRRSRGGRWQPPRILSCVFPLSPYPGSFGTSAGEPLATISWFWDSITTRGARLLAVVVVVARLSRARCGSDGARREFARVSVRSGAVSVVVVLSCCWCCYVRSGTVSSSPTAAASVVALDCSWPCVKGLLLSRRAQDFLPRNLLSAPVMSSRCAFRNSSSRDLRSLAFYRSIYLSFVHSADHGESGW